MRIIKVSEFFNTLNKTSLKVNVKDYDENKISVFIEDFWVADLEKSLLSFDKKEFKTLVKEALNESDNIDVFKMCGILLNSIQ